MVHGPKPTVTTYNSASAGGFKAKPVSRARYDELLQLVEPQLALAAPRSAVSTPFQHRNASFSMVFPRFSQDFHQFSRSPSRRPSISDSQKVAPHGHAAAGGQ